MAQVDQQVKDYTAYVYPRFVRIGRTMPQLAIHFTNAGHTPVLADAAGWRAVVDRLLVELGEAGQELVDSPAPQPLIQTIHQRVLIVGRSCCELAGDLKAAVAAHDVTALNVLTGMGWPRSRARQRISPVKCINWVQDSRLGGHWVAVLASRKDSTSTGEENAMTNRLVWIANTATYPSWLTCGHTTHGNGRPAVAGEGATQVGDAWYC